MQNTEIVASNGQAISLKDESRMLLKDYATDCLQAAKAPIKRLLCSFAERLFNRMIDKLQQKLSV